MFEKYRNIFFHKKGPSTEESDEALLAAYKVSRDPSLLAELFQRYTHLVYGVCLKYLENEEESKDAVMDIYLSLSGNLHKFDISNFKNWLYSVSRNHCMMKFRERRRQERMISEEKKKSDDIRMENGTEVNLSPVEDETMISALKNAIAHLDSVQKICIELMYLQDKSYHEISILTGYSMNQVKSSIQNGKRNLKLILQRYDQEGKQ